MKIKIRELIEAQSSIAQIADYRGLNAKANYNISKTTADIVKELNLYQKTRDAKLIELASKDADGQPILRDIKDDKGEVKMKDGKALQEYVLTDEAKAELKKIDQDLLEHEVDIYCTPFKEEDLVVRIKDADGKYVEECIPPILFQNAGWLLA